MGELMEHIQRIGAGFGQKGPLMALSAAEAGPDAFAGCVDRLLRAPSDVGTRRTSNGTGATAEAPRNSRFRCRASRPRPRATDDIIGTRSRRFIASRAPHRWTVP